ncbi:MAG: PhzF family phenazine biosynthesis protein [Gemmatimonadales bacterium]
MPCPLYQVDAFTDKPFAGNPAAVCVLEQARDEAWMQAVAREMNLPETAYLVRFADGHNLRWFTPGTEVELCGHATLASAHILWEHGYLKKGTAARFYTKSGLLSCTRGDDGWIDMDFPAKPATPVEPPAGLAGALGIKPLGVYRNQWDYLVEAESEEVVRTMQPDFGMLATLHVRGTIVTSAASTAPYDFVSRFFAPGVGVPEDPVTGSAHVCLGPFWAERIRRTQHVRKTDFLAYQASPRGGVVRVRLVDSKAEGTREDRVLLGGQAVTVLHAKLYG